MPGYLQAKGRRLSFEWALIDGVNDRDQDARQLVERSRSLPLPAHVNLIPLNPTPGYAVRGLAAQSGAGVPRSAARGWRQRDDPADARHRDRRRLRPAAGRARDRSHVGRRTAATLNGGLSARAP